MVRVQNGSRVSRSPSGGMGGLPKCQKWVSDQVTDYGVNAKGVNPLLGR